MDIKIFYIPQGMCMGRVLKYDNDGADIENPTLVVTRSGSIILVPLLDLVEEKYVSIKYSDCMFNKFFTPKNELRNQYTSIFGGIQIPQNMLDIT